MNLTNIENWGPQVVINLHNRGLSVFYISTKLNLPVGLVEQILNKDIYEKDFETLFKDD